MAKAQKSALDSLGQYQHEKQQRLNNPPVGLVTPTTDMDGESKTYEYDPHLDPQLIWAGKAEHTSFEVPTVSLHVHERIDPKAIIKAAKKGGGQIQTSLFELPGENLPMRTAVEFYKHPHGWSNRLIAGDSLLVMNSLLEKEGMAGQVQMIYIDPPYGVKYGSNFQPFVNKRDVKDGKDEDLTQEPETIKAFRDTWELGIHSYLAYLRDRLLLARELLSESGSVFVQISDENLHFVRSLMDEIFGADNFISLITFAKTSGYGDASALSSVSDYLLWFAKTKKNIKFRQPYISKEIGSEIAREYKYIESSDGITRRAMNNEELSNPKIIPKGWRAFRPSALTSQGTTLSGSSPFLFEREKFEIGNNQHWKTTTDGLAKLAVSNRIMKRAKSLSYIRYLEDFPVAPINNNWLDTRWGFDASEKVYVVQTNVKVILRCILMTTDPGDLVLDPTCGSGTTAYVAEQWGRRWITCDTSRVAVSLAKQRIMTAVYDYYELAHQEEGISSGFRYKTVPHVTLKSIANNPEIKEGMTRKEIERAIAKYADQETLYDQPSVDNSKVRVTGPFTVEAVPSPVVKPLVEVESGQPADASLGRSGETLRQQEWREELFRTGIITTQGQRLKFSRVEPLPGTRYLHAEAETAEDEPKRAVISFGPEHAPLEQRQVALALEEANHLVPSPKILIFAAFQFDPEASKDIDETIWPGITFLKAQMNGDLFTDDLKKKRSSNESFWLIGQPDVKLEKIKEGNDKGKCRIKILGFDYYNPVNGAVESGGSDKVVMWMLDTDYDGCSLFPRQVFFPMAGSKEGWAKLAKTLKAEIDEDRIEAFRGTVSLPFEMKGRVAVKIIDNRGIESLRILDERSCKR
jgi:adenine-specific DNA-methyltransferase